jgi:hypothetical protein
MKQPAYRPGGHFREHRSPDSANGGSCPHAPFGETEAAWENLQKVFAQQTKRLHSLRRYLFIHDTFDAVVAQRISEMRV